MIKALENKTRLIAGIIAVLFIIVNTILIANEFYWLSLLPFAVLIIYFYFYSLDKVLLFITLCTPLALNIKDYEMSIGVSLPTEPLMAGVLVLFFIKLFYDNPVDFKIMKHPVTIAILINLSWMFITSISSELPLVSFKYLLSRLWFVVPFYFFGIILFKNYRNIKTFAWMYMISLMVVVILTTYKHYTFGFDKDIGHYVMQPFYNDHTAYGAVLAMFIPVIFGFIFNTEYTLTGKIFSALAFFVLLAALIFSMSRAAWVSVAAVLGIYIIIKLRIKFWLVFSSFLVILVLFFTFRVQIIDKLARNKQDSSADLVEHVQSISNITSDASNLERLNRWNSAIKMFLERPISGWGPGTYQFVYAPFQNSNDHTIISTNAGNMGNAHSEYIGPLAEMGVFGLLAVLGILTTVIYTGLRLHRRATDKRVKYLSLLFTFGIITYYIHGFLNNFLDSDKLSVPFWGFIAILVAMDIYHWEKPEEKIKKSEV